MEASLAANSWEKDTAQRTAKFRRLILGSVLKHAALLALSGVFLVPWVWTISTSLKELPQVFVFPPVWIPAPIKWDNYPMVFIKYPFHLYAANTVVIATASVVGAVVSNTLVAYSLSCLRWRGQNVAFVFVLATMMVPYQVTMIPLYIVFRNLNWLNTYLPLVVPIFFGSAYYTFLLRQFFNTIPYDLSEAASADGASELQIMLQIILPLAKPAIAVVALFQFINSWNDFLGPLIYINESTKFTIAIGLRQMQSNIGVTEVNLVMAASLMTIFPVIVVFFFAQKTFIQGITMTGLKG